MISIFLFLSNLSNRLRLLLRLGLKLGGILVWFGSLFEDVFKFNKQVFPLYFKYLNRKSKVELSVPSYERKSKRLVSNFQEMTAFFADLQK